MVLIEIWERRRSNCYRVNFLVAMSLACTSPSPSLCLSLTLPLACPSFHLACLTLTLPLAHSVSDSPCLLLPRTNSLSRRRGVVTGKSGKTYWLNLDDLGGYQNGPNKLDDVIQVYQNENSVYAGAGVYPLEGGYIYINVIQYPTHVFKFSCNNGVPSFNHVADSPEKNAYILGVGHGTVTSLNDQPGTGLVWTSDVEGSNLRIHNAIPDPTSNLLVEINSFVLPGVTKFTRPVFGDGIVFQGTTIGAIYALGAPVNLPMNCT